MATNEKLLVAVYQIPFPLEVPARLHSVVRFLGVRCITNAPDDPLENAEEASGGRIGGGGGT